MNELPYPITKVVNLTAKTIFLHNSNGQVASRYEPSGMVARIAPATISVMGFEQYHHAQIKSPVNESRYNFIPVRYTNHVNEVEGLPAPELGVIYLVEMQVLKAVPENRRHDVYSVFSIKDDAGADLPVCLIKRHWRKNPHVSMLLEFTNE